MRFHYVVGVALLFAQPAFAQTTAVTPPPEVLTRAYACIELQEDAARLACYDEAVGRLREAQSAGQVVAVDRAQAEAIERDSFGFPLPSLSRLMPRLGRDGEHEALADLQVQVERVADSFSGRHSFIMSNGQVWTQTDPQRTGNVRPGDTVTIRRGAMGSFMLVSSRGGAAHRVRREN